jgi:hypothetical protein
MPSDLTPSSASPNRLPGAPVPERPRTGLLLYCLNDPDVLLTPRRSRSGALPPAVSPVAPAGKRLSLFLCPAKRSSNPTEWLVPTWREFVRKRVCWSCVGTRAQRPTPPDPSIHSNGGKYREFFQSGQDGSFPTHGFYKTLCISLKSSTGNYQGNRRDDGAFRQLQHVADRL